MADEPQTGDEQTVPMAEFKSLQRKLDRASKKAAKAEERAESLEAGQGRTEDLLEGLATLMTEGDAESTARAQTLVNTNSARRTADTSAAQLTARLGQTIDDADENWDDVKFDSARNVLRDMNSSGDMSRGSEAERLVKEAIEASSTESYEERLEREVQAAVLKDRQDSGRVDTTESASTDARVRFSDLTNMDPKQGVGAMRETTKKALDQLFKG